MLDNIVSDLGGVMDKIDVVLAAIPAVLKLVTILIAAASALSPLLPPGKGEAATTTAQKWYSRARSVLSFVALNVLHARPGDVAAQKAVDALAEADKQDAQKSPPAGR